MKKYDVWVRLFETADVRLRTTIDFMGDFALETSNHGYYPVWINKALSEGKAVIIREIIMDDNGRIVKVNGVVGFPRTIKVATPDDELQALPHNNYVHTHTEVTVIPCPGHTDFSWGKYIGPDLAVLKTEDVFGPNPFYEGPDHNPGTFALSNVDFDEVGFNRYE